VAAARGCRVVERRETPATPGIGEFVLHHVVLQVADDPEQKLVTFADREHGTKRLALLSAIAGARGVAENAAHPCYREFPWIVGPADRPSQQTDRGASLLQSERTTKHVFVTGGVASSLGKGLTASSLGNLLTARGLRVTMQKLDPYLNVDPGR